MAFTAETQHIRAWVFAFDATHGRLVSDGQALTLARCKGHRGAKPDPGWQETGLFR